MIDYYKHCMAAWNDLHTGKITKEEFCELIGKMKQDVPERPERKIYAPAPKEDWRNK